MFLSAPWYALMMMESDEMKMKKIASMEKEKGDVREEERGKKELLRIYRKSLINQFHSFRG